MLQFLILLTLIFFIECAVGIVAFLHRDQVRTWLTLAHALWCSVCLNDGFQFKNTIKTSHALWGDLLTVSCMRITQLHANTLPATARGIKEKTSEKRLGVKRFHFMCVSKDLKWKIGGRGEEILVGGGRRGCTIAILRKQPFLLAPHRWGRFARKNVCDSATEIPCWWRKSMFT